MIGPMARGHRARHAKQDSFSIALLVVAGLVASPASASELPKSLDAEEWKGFQDTLERFTDRMNELQDDVKGIVAQRESDEQARIESIYGPMIKKMQEDETAQRKIAMERLEAFLRKYPVSPYSANMKFRLADLYFQQADIEYFVAFKEYQRFIVASQDHPEIIPPEPPSKDYARSVALYQDILTNNQDFENLADTYYMLAWCHNVDDATVYDPELARASYEMIIERYRGTGFANDANMALGEYWFDLPNPTKNTPTAIKYYEAVLADGEKGRNYDKALYKLGWSEYKLNHYDAALADMVQLLDFSDKEFLQTGKPANTRPEAIKYLAISYSDMGLNFGRKPIDIAVEHLNKVGDRPWQHEEFEVLSEVLMKAAKVEDAIDVWAYMQERWPLDPKNPVYQHNIAINYLKLPSGADTERSDAAMAALSQRYADESPWFAANRTNADAIASARDFIEQSLGQVATTLYLNAEETGDVAGYAAAAEKFREFLDKYPFGKEYNSYEYYFATSLYASNQFEAAIAAYKQVLKNDHSPFREGARYAIMQARKEIVLAKYGKLPDVPPGQVVEQTITSEFGKAVTVYTVSDEQKALVEAIDDILPREFSDPDVLEALEKTRPQVTYLVGQLFYKHGLYEEARKRFNEVIDKYPKAKEAGFAAGLLVATYSNEGDLERVSSLIDELKGKALGQDGEGLGELATIQEQAQFNIALNMGKNGNHLGASKAFLAFLKRFPESQYASVVLFSAGREADLAGNAVEAIKIYEQFVAKYPTDERSQPLYFIIGDTYAATLNLPKAIENYENVVRLFPDSQDAQSAMYNSAFFRVGIGDHKGAAQEYEQYAQKYTGGDAEGTFWAAGEQWELVNDAEAFNYYKRYLERYGASNPDHAIEALYKVAKAQEKKPGNQAPATWARLDDTFRTAAGEGKAISQKSSALAAEGAVRELEREFQSMTVTKWTNDQKKNVDMILDVKNVKIPALVAHGIDIIGTYRDFDSTQACQYYMGMAALNFADSLYKVPVPKEFQSNEELIAAYNEQIDGLRLPIEDSGKKALKRALDKATVDKRWSVWNSKMLGELNSRFPSEFPSERDEARGKIDPGDVQGAGPTSDISTSEETK